jgi:hypothetical protein
MREEAARALGPVVTGQPEVVPALLAALQDADERVRCEAVGALGQVGAGQPEVVKALLTALQDTYWLVRCEAVGALGQVGAGQPEVIPAMLTALKEVNRAVRRDAARALGQVEVKDPDKWHLVLVALHRRLYEWTVDIEEIALEAIQKQTEGRSLPDAPRSVRHLRARRRLLQQVAFWLLVVTILLGLGLLGTWLTGVLNANSFLLRFVGVVAALLTFAAGVTQIIGWSFRDVREQGEQRKQRT